MQKQKGKISTLVGVTIIVAVAVVLFGGVFAYQYFAKQNFETVQPVAQNQTQTETQTATDETADWKTYINDEYGFEFKYPAGFFDKFYGPSEDECSNRHPDIQKYSTRFIFEADQEGTTQNAISMGITIICTKLEEKKVSNFIEDLSLIAGSSNTDIKQIGGRTTYQTYAYSKLSADETFFTFTDLGENTLQIAFSNYNLNKDTKDVVDKILSNFKFTK